MKIEYRSTTGEKNVSVHVWQSKKRMEIKISNISNCIDLEFILIVCASAKKNIMCTLLETDI